jgi:SAM-dependent methyltransferase
MTTAKPTRERSATGAGVHAAHPALAADDPLVNRTRAVWTAGDFDRIAAGYRAGAEAFVQRLGLTPGEAVLDVACGTGNLSLPAARTGARVTGLDIAANLLATARERAAGARLPIQFDEGNAEEMPYADASFDTVVTMYGAMFAPRPERTAAELLRVVRPGGRIAMANWTPGSFIGSMLRAHTAMVPPPSGVPSTLLWGDETMVRERFAGARQVTLTPRSIRFDYPMSPTAVVQLFRDWYGPTIRTFEALGAESQRRLFDTLVTLWSDGNLSVNGSTQVDSEYLEVIVTR